MAERPWSGALRWLGIGLGSAVGLSYDDRFVVAAVVHTANRRIGGVSTVELDPSTVVAGAVERPAELGAAVRSALAPLKYPTGAPGGICLPIGLDHLGSEWATARPTAEATDDDLVVELAARSAGVEVRAREPLPVVGASLGHEAAAADDRLTVDEPISVVARSGWLTVVVTTADRHVECRTERNAEFRTPPDIRWGVSSARAGQEIDPFTWPRPTRSQRQIALLAAGAALLT